MSHRIRRAIFLPTAALVAAVAIAGCGDSNSDLDPAQVVLETLNNDEQVTSGTFDVTLGGSVEGESTANGEISLSGSFQGDPADVTGLPQLDLTGSASGDVAGTSINAEGGLVVTDDNAYVEYQDTFYEVGASIFNAISSLAGQAAAAQGAVGATGAVGVTETGIGDQCQTLIEQAGGNAEACAVVDVFSWLELTNEGSEDVEGVQTIHVHGSVDVPAMIDNINATIAAAEVPGAEEISEKTASEIDEAIGELGFDLYSGAEDRLLRGLDLNIVVDAAAISEAADAPVSSIDVDLTTRLGAINQTQTIETPTDPQPLDDLLGQFGLSSAAIQGAITGYTQPG